MKAVRLSALVAVIATLGAGSLVGQGRAVAPKGSSATQIVVPKGQWVEIVYTAGANDPIVGGLNESIANAIDMAVAGHPSIRGFPIRINDVESSCQDDNSAVASQIVGNRQNVAVLGHICSGGFESALPIYQAAGVVVVSGSASRDTLPSLGPTVFDRTIVRDGDGGAAWYDAVSALPRNIEWRAEYEAEFGEAPAYLSDTYFDAASLLTKRLQQVSKMVNGNLVINRAALARAVRETAGFQGVTCSVSFDAVGNRINDAAALARCAQG
jgi:ABC-type branched-subunit amino acid transport system substrate-binding protein